jgi:peptide-methionine (S)-S-oxide reductase
VELVFQREPGVTRTAVGYTQGKTANPRYEEVCSGRSGHTEAVLVEFDPAVVSYEKLCELLWSKIDATQVDGQGNDWGSQYRTGIYPCEEEQMAVALASREAHQARIGKTVATEVLPATQWWDAESYHQSYLAKGGRNGRAQSAEKGCKDPIRCEPSAASLHAAAVMHGSIVWALLDALLVHTCSPACAQLLRVNTK